MGASLASASCKLLDLADGDKLAKTLSKPTTAVLQAHIDKSADDEALYCKDFGLGALKVTEDSHALG